MRLGKAEVYPYGEAQMALTAFKSGVGLVMKKLYLKPCAKNMAKILCTKTE
nr:MAG TPA: hypothetical protein [Caudoviricetes sp.]